MITPYEINAGYGLAFVPAYTFSPGHGDRKEWRRRMTGTGRRNFYGLIVMKPTPFGTALYRDKGEASDPYNIDWEVLNLRKPGNLGWVP